VALSDGRAASSTSMLRDADTAMYLAKESGRNQIEIFETGSHAVALKSLQLINELHGALTENEFRLRYQPVIDLATGAVVAVEALIRWEHPHRGLLGPDQFIPMAEETGLILPLGRHVLDKACRQVRSIQDRLALDLPISVNLSPRQFQDAGLLSQVAAALTASGVAPGLLMLEITETVVMEDLPGAREVMKKLSRLGVRLAIDDFGTGHSSLAYLKQFPVHEVKVDRSFVQGVAESPVDSAIVRAVISLADAMGIAAVAEGVETEDQVAELSTLGCQVGQGYYFSRPLGAGEFDDLLSRHFGRPRRAAGRAVPLLVEKGADRAGS
jgi:EAL domain-containing protein (putative c-di-GMP-specific phosphodiesterase class I)